MKKLLLIGIILLLIGGVTAGAVTNSYSPDENTTSAETNNDTQNNTLNLNNKITVIDESIVDFWYQYIEIIIMANNETIATEPSESDIEINESTTENTEEDVTDYSNTGNNTINFTKLSEESVSVGEITFAIPNETEMTEGYAMDESDFYSSEIFNTSDNCSFGIIMIANPNGTAKELSEEMKENNFFVTDDIFKKINSSDNITAYKFEYERITHYIYDEGDTIVIIVMDQENDNLFMYLTNSSTDGRVDESNPYLNTSSSNTTNESSNNP